MIEGRAAARPSQISDEVSPAHFVRALRFLRMKLVEEAVEGRCKNDAETREERQAAEQRIAQPAKIFPPSVCSDDTGPMPDKIIAALTKASTHDIGSKAR